MDDLILEYYTHMKNLDTAFHWSDPNWWQDENDARVVLAKENKGFAILGYGRYADKDVKSEIRELYSKDPLIFRSLVHACLPFIEWPFGFKVLQHNERAWRCFESLTLEMGYHFLRSEDYNGKSAVYKYRIYP